MNYILEAYKELIVQPDGKKKFSDSVCEITPYFKSINPMVVELRPGFGKWSMEKVRNVENHLGTVHAIAMCNLCEFVGGICMEVSIPKHRRWIPVGMTVAYLKKATTDLTAECDLSQVDWDHCTEVHCMIEVKDNTGLVVMTADITMKVSNKKKK